MDFKAVAQNAIQIVNRATILATADGAIAALAAHEMLGKIASGALILVAPEPASSVPAPEKV